MKKRILVLCVFMVLLVLVAMLLLNACSSAKTTAAVPSTTAPSSAPNTQAVTPVAQSTKTLTIGLITSATGGMAAGFKSEIDGAKPTEDLLNQMGGITINGQQYNIKIEVEDDQSSPQGAVTAANKLIQNGVKFVIQPMFIPSVMAVSPVLEAAGVLSINPMCSDATLYGGTNKHAFNAWPTSYDVTYMDKYLQSKYPQAKKIALVYPDDPGAKPSHDFTVADAPKLGMQIVFDQPFALDTQDFASIITKALATQPDVIDVLFTITPWAQGLINSARDQGFTGVFYAPCIFGDINILNSMINPKYANDIVNGGADVLSPTMPDIVKKLRTLIEAQIKNVPFNMDNLNALQPLLPLLQGINNAQSLDPEKVVAAMESIQSWDTLLGKGISGGPDTGGNHNILPPIPVSIIMNGKVQADLIQR